MSKTLNYCWREHLRARAEYEEQEAQKRRLACRPESRPDRELTSPAVGGKRAA